MAVGTSSCWLLGIREHESEACTYTSMGHLHTSACWRVQTYCSNNLHGMMMHGASNVPRDKSTSLPLHTFGVWLACVLCVCIDPE